MPIEQFQYSHDIRRHRFRVQFIQCNNSCFLLGKDYEDHGTNMLCQPEESATLYKHCNRIRPFSFEDCWHINLFPLIPACTARPGLPLSPPETAFLESPYYRPQTASIADRHHPTNFHSVTYTQTDDAAFEAGSDNDHKSFLRMRVIFTVEYPAELFRFRRVLDDILSSFDVF